MPVARARCAAARRRPRRRGATRGRRAAAAANPVRQLPYRSAKRPPGGPPGARGAVAGGYAPRRLAARERRASRLRQDRRNYGSYAWVAARLRNKETSWLIPG